MHSRSLPYTYAWSDDANATGSYRSGLSSNLYTTTVTDANSCTTAASVFVKDADPILVESMDVLIIPSECSANTGELRVLAGPDGGNPPFSYTWSTGEEGSIIDDLAGGNYQLTIVDEQGCTISTEYEIPIDGQPIISDVVIENTCPGQNFGVIAIIAVPADGGNLEYAWSTGSTDIVIADLSSGSYTVTVTDQSTGCTLEKTYMVEDFSMDPLVINGTAQNNCESMGNNNGQISLDIEGGIEPYDVIWNTGETAKTILNLSTGDYSATVTDKCGTTQYYSGTVISDQITINIDVYFSNFEDIFINANPNGGTPPYEYEWNTGSTLFFLDQDEEGTYSVIVTDQNGCSKSESVDVVCDPSNFTYVTASNCALPFHLMFATNQGLGTGTFKIKVEKKINQEFELVDYRIIPSPWEIPDYEYSDDDAGIFRVTATNYCGYTQTDIFNACVDCDYYFYEAGDNYVASVMGDLLLFEMECPCTKDCDFLGFTTDKVKLDLNQFALAQFSNTVSGFPSFEVVWPTGPASNIYFNGNEDKFVVSGTTQYVLSNDEFDAGDITASVSMTLPYGLGEVCSLNIPFEFGKNGYNGYFYKMTLANPFSNYTPPYNWGTSACLYECTIPFVNGVLYDNEPIDYTDQLNNYFSLCAVINGETEGSTEFFFVPTQ